jgi:hypothetical protein
MACGEAAPRTSGAIQGLPRRMSTSQEEDDCESYQLAGHGEQGIRTQAAFVLAAFVSGEDYVMSLHKSALNFMSIGWAGAVIAYGVGWYLGDRWERRGKAAPLPGG